MTLPLILGLVLFLGLVLLFLMLLPVSSVEGALLEEVADGDDLLSGSARQESGDGGRGAVIEPGVDARPHARCGLNTQPLAEACSLPRRQQKAETLPIDSRAAPPALRAVLPAILPGDRVRQLGFYLPDFWLSHAIQKRRDQIKLSLPDALDMLAVCMEAGLGLDQSIVRIGHEFGISHPQLSEEFLQVNFEQRAGVPRLAAWKSFADRVNIESARSFVAMLIQTDRFGTPLSKSLGAFSDALRTQRRQQAEEMAAKTTIKLVPPLVFFIFPAMGVVTVGPAVVTVMKNMRHLV